MPTNISENDSDPVYDLPEDYEECGVCGFDHLYDSGEPDMYAQIKQAHQEAAVSDSVYQTVGVERGEPLPCFTSIGCYSIIYYTKSEEPMCGECVSKYDDECDPVTLAGTYDEGETLECCICGSKIESSYGPPEDNTKE